MTLTTKIILILVCLFALSGVVFNYFTNKNLKDALEKLDHATIHLDSAIVRIKSADSTVTGLKESLNGYNKFLNDSRSQVERINSDYEKKVQRIGVQTAGLISDIEKIKFAMNKINPPNDKIKINVTDK